MAAKVLTLHVKIIVSVNPGNLVTPPQIHVYFFQGTVTAMIYALKKTISLDVI